MMAPIFVLLSWAPFEFDPPSPTTNAVAQDSDVLSFGGPSRVTLSPELRNLDSGSLVFDLRYPCGSAAGGRVLTLSAGLGRPFLTVDQVADRLLLGSGPGTELVPIRGTHTGEACDTWIELGLDLAAGEVTFRGAHTMQATLVPGPIHSSARIDFGTPLVGDDHWQGEIRRPRLLTSDGTIDLAPELHAPASFWVLPSRLLGAGERDRAELVQARLWHAIGGVLLGLGLGGAFPRVSLRRCLAVGVTFVVLLNLGKVVVAYRHPSVGTTLLQAGGLGVGAAATRFRTPGVLQDAGSSSNAQLD